MEKKITVFTPTYNRAHILHHCYKSLLQQNNNQFKWLIIDDGSTDNTKEVVNEWIEENKIEIKYVYKKNGGKHTALNLGFQIIDTELTFIVDSDDILTSDAIESIISDWEKYKCSSIAGISYLRGYSIDETIGNIFPDNRCYNGIDIQFRYKISGDKAEVWRTDILSQYSFPVYDDEKFQGENYVWWQIALKYDMMYVNKIIYITEYHKGGLTKSGRRLRINCPRGGMDNSKMGFNKKFPLKERIKRGILYNCYGFFAHKNIKERIKTSNNHKYIVLCTYLFGFFLYKYWKYKYL